MENQNNLTLNDQAVDALRVSAKWTMFLSILGFIGIGFMLLVGLFMSVAMSAMPTEAPVMGGGMMGGMLGAMKGVIAVVYIVLALVYFFPIYYLYKYSKGIKDAIDSSNSDLLCNALVNLKSHHKFLGIVAIVCISMYILFFIGIAIFAASFASSAASGM
ncbi:DUF5362 family protein [Flavobacterium phycosphaerae]|uniref:DUF5362 family protein n=1 Tax=Flavobacterium phycosphaerae TaxID=2697515 RepID=UPI001389FBF2|nr:DUF5362 family protein [Flavobacterium phycosphaerae]